MGQRMAGRGDFSGSVPELYERYLVPLLFEPYAVDLAGRVARRRPARVLEIAAGTGVLTRELAKGLPPEVPIVATDLNQPMLDKAAAVGTSRPVEWRACDAMALPFDDASFDVVACQFAAMFFPDRPKAFSEARRVLRPGGAFLFSVWDRIEENEFADVVTRALEAPFSADPPRFLSRLPHGYSERREIERDLGRAGFDGTVRIDTRADVSRAASPWVAAVAYCQGTPLRSEIEARDASRLHECTVLAAEAIAERFGPGPVEGRIQGHVVSVDRPSQDVAFGPL